MNFFRKSGSVTFWAFTILHLCAKNQQKLMSQSQKKLVTNGQTNERHLIYRTSEVGPKKDLPVTCTNFISQSNDESKHLKQLNLII